MEEIWTREIANTKANKLHRRKIPCVNNAQTMVTTEDGQAGTAKCGILTLLKHYLNRKEQIACLKLTLLSNPL
ncbi:MAG: hypothetical protein LRY71_15220 [Bacillaceae bacterium]|nr:hypothetical protein [Bacillaceae bacterium]